MYQTTEGENLEGGDVLCDTMGYCGQGVAQEELWIRRIINGTPRTFSRTEVLSANPGSYASKMGEKCQSYLYRPGEQKEQIIKKKIIRYWVIREGHSVKWKQKHKTGGTLSFACGE